MEVVAVGLTRGWFPRAGVPAAVAKGLCERCPPRWPGSALVGDYLGLKWRAVLLHTLHLGFTKLQD